MKAEWKIALTRDEALVLSDYLDRWERTEGYSLPLDFGERAAFISLHCSLESADDGTVFSPGYAEEIADAKARLIERFGKFE